MGDSFSPLLAGTNDNPPDVDRDVMWVYEQLDAQTAVPDDAPSFGAWGLLKWARTNRDRFFEQMLPKAMASMQKRKPNGSAEENDEYIADPGIEFVRERLREYHRLDADGFAHRAPQEITERAEKLLKKFGSIQISPEWSETFVNDVVHDIAFCIEFALRSPEEYKRLNNEWRKKHHLNF